MDYKRLQRIIKGYTKQPKYPLNPIWHPKSLTIHVEARWLLWEGEAYTGVA